MKKQFINIFLFLVFTSPCVSQEFQPTFERITVRDGLSQSTIYSILQDNQGFLWFATQDRGLNKYNGYEFTTYFNIPGDTNSLSKNQISHLIQAKDCTIYIATWGGGLCTYDPVNDKFITFLHDHDNPSSISQNKVQRLFEDSKGTIWIGTQKGGVNKYIPGINKFVKYFHEPNNPNSLSNNRIWDIREDSKGYIWFATSNGLCKLDVSNEIFTRFYHDSNSKNSISDNKIRTIFIDQEDKVWVGTSLGLDIINTEKNIVHFTFPIDNVKPNPINRIYQDSKGDMWIGTHIGGIINFNLSTKKHKQFLHDPNDDFTIGYNDIRDIYEDLSGNLWIATRGGGVNKLNLYPKKFYNIKNKPKNPNSLSNNRVKALLEDKDGNLWIGTDVGGGLDMYDRKKRKFLQFFHGPENPNTIISNDITALHQDKIGNIWIGTDGSGISVYNPSTNKFHHFQNDPETSTSLISNEIWVFFEDSENNLWIGTNDGLDLYVPGKNTFTHFVSNDKDTSSLSDDCIWSVFEDSNKDFWVGTNNGLNRFDKKTGSFIRYKNISNDSSSIKSNIVFAIYEDGENNLWVGTANGLNLYNRKSQSFPCYKEKQNIIGNPIYGILEDNDNNLWISTINGISKLDKQNCTFRSYDINDGLQNNDYSRGACLKSVKGELVFGGVNGVTLFYPDSILDNLSVPPVMLTNFQIFNKPVKIADKSTISSHINYITEINLNHNQTVVSFEFSALDYTKPQKNLYRYKLEGFDENWNLSRNRRFANYTNIPTGKYHFLVQGSNNDNIWNREGISIEIIKSPPYYETLWFYLIEAAAFISIIFVFLRLRLRSLERDKRILEQNVYERTREINLQNQKLEKAYHQVQQSSKSKEVFLANTSHEIRTPLNVIIGYTNLLLNYLKDKKALSYMQNIRTSSNNLLVILNDILDISKIESGKLTVEKIDFDIHTLLKNLTNIFQIKVGEKELAFEYEIDKNIPQFLKGDTYRLNQILSNLLDNAVKFTPKRGMVKLIVSAEKYLHTKTQLTFQIIDSGIGIPKEKAGKIFESFTQATSDTTRKFGGTGLGLSIVKSLVDLQQGKISVESEENEGTKFTVKLNYTIGESKNIVKHEDDYKISRAKKIEEINILLVEDNEVNVLLAIDTIKIYNSKINIDVAENGKIAVDKLKTQNYSLIIMDVQMPVMDGYEATKFIRTNFDDSKRFIPILGMTAHAMKEEKEKCLALGMNDYLTKPFVPEELFKKIELLIGAATQPNENIEQNDQLFYSNNAFLDLSTLEKIYGKNKQKILKILHLYKDNIPKQLLELKESSDKRNWNNVKVVAHSLKTSFSYLNFYELKEIAQDIEISIINKEYIKGVEKKNASLNVLWNKEEEKLVATIKEVSKQFP